MKLIIICSASLLALLATDFAYCQTVQFRLSTTDLDGVEIDEIIVGESFQLHVFAQDVRESPGGILSAHLDVEYDDALVTPIVDSLVHGDQFGEIPRGDFQTARVINEAGSFAAGQSGAPPLPDPVGIQEALLFSTVFDAINVGTAEFSSNVADTLPLNATTVLGISGAIPAEQMLFGMASIRIAAVPEPGSLVIGLFVFVIGFSRFSARSGE